MITTLNTVIVHIPNPYELGKTIGDDDSLFLYYNTSNPDVSTVKMEGEVVSLPLAADINLEVGDIIYFHHNIARMTYTSKNTKVSSYKIDEEKNLYEVPLNLIYGYKRDGKVYSISPFCFVKPLDLETEAEEKTSSGIFLPPTVRKNNIKQYGYITHSNPELEKDLDIHVGDKIIFSNFSEYEINIDDDIVYRMRTDWIIGKVNEV